jgi:thiazole synthase ThiGH ThiG subunit
MDRQRRNATFCQPGPHRPHASRQRGIFQLEILFALLVVGMLLTALTTASLRQDKALRQFAARRAALRQAETALLNLQAGAADADHSVQVRRLATEHPASGFVWVEVTATNGSQAAHLVGLVPAAAPLSPEVPLEKR